MGLSHWCGDAFPSLGELGVTDREVFTRVTAEQLTCAFGIGGRLVGGDMLRPNLGDLGGTGGGLSRGLSVSSNLMIDGCPMEPKGSPRDSYAGIMSGAKNLGECGLVV